MTNNDTTSAASTVSTAAVPKGTQQKTQTAQNAGRISAQVVKAVDGDTIKVKIASQEETVRMLLIDTPETHHPSKPVQPFGPEAAALTKSMVEGKNVELERDVSDARDKYGRLLYYVYVDGKSVQETLLEKGLARVAYVYPPNVKYVDQYRVIQAKAQKAGTGIWSIENYAQEDGYHQDAAKKKQETVVKAPPAPKKEAAKKEVPVVQETPELTPSTDVFYQNCTAARAAGAAPLYEGDPGYRPKLDRDHDGVACE